MLPEATEAARRVASRLRDALVAAASLAIVTALVGLAIGPVERDFQLDVDIRLIAEVTDGSRVAADAVVVYGEVLDEDQEPIEGARVVLTGRAGGSARSGDDGTFWFETAPGEHRLTVRDRGASGSIELETDEGRAYEVHARRSVDGSFTVVPLGGY